MFIMYIYNNKKVNILKLRKKLLKFYLETLESRTYKFCSEGAFKKGTA